MIATAALGDVVKQTGEIEPLGFDHLLDDLARQRKFMAKFRHGEAPQVAHDHQRMRVHRVDVEQVMLHLADNFAKGGQVGAKHAIGVHAPQLMGNAMRLTQDFHEKAAARQVLAEFAVDAWQVRTQKTDGVGAHAFELQVLLQDQKDFQHGERCALEHPGMGDFDEAEMRLETTIDGFDFCPSGRKNCLFEVLQQDFTQ